MHPATFSGQKETRLSRPGGAHYYVIFRIDSQHYALPLDHVARALRMVAITPVPEMPEWVSGIINMAGQTLPVLNLRYLFDQKNKDPELQDRMLILQVQEQTMA
ncbi:MAG: chemotaxis protein CheW, partial [Deltaproteobacteria bacterium]